MPNPYDQYAPPGSLEELFKSEPRQPRQRRPPRRRRLDEPEDPEAPAEVAPEEDPGWFQKYGPAITRGIGGFAGVGWWPGALAGGASEAIAQGIEQGTWDPELNKKRIAAEAVIGGAGGGFAKMLGTGASVARGLFSGAALGGSAPIVRHGIEEGEWDPREYAGEVGLGAAISGTVGGGLAKLLGMLKPSRPAGPMSRYEIETTAVPGGQTFGGPIHVGRGGKTTMGEGKPQFVNPVRPIHSSGAPPASAAPAPTTRVDYDAVTPSGYDLSAPAAPYVGAPVVETAQQATTRLRQQAAQTKAELEQTKLNELQKLFAGRGDVETHLNESVSAVDPVTGHKLGATFKEVAEEGGDAASKGAGGGAGTLLNQADVPVTPAGGGGVNPAGMAGNDLQSELARVRAELEAARAAEVSTPEVPPTNLGGLEEPPLAGSPVPVEPGIRTPPLSGGAEAFQLPPNAVHVGDLDGMPIYDIGGRHVLADGRELGRAVASVFDSPTPSPRKPRGYDEPFETSPGPGQYATDFRPQPEAPLPVATPEPPANPLAELLSGKKPGRTRSKKTPEGFSAAVSKLLNQTEEGVPTPRAPEVPPVAPEAPIVPEILPPSLNQQLDEDMARWAATPEGQRYLADAAAEEAAAKADPLGTGIKAYQEALAEDAADYAKPIGRGTTTPDASLPAIPEAPAPVAAPEAPQAPQNFITNLVNRGQILRTRVGTTGQNYRLAKEAAEVGEIPTAAYARAAHKAEQAALKGQPSPAAVPDMPSTPTNWMQDEAATIARLEALPPEQRLAAFLEGQEAPQTPANLLDEAPLATPDAEPEWVAKAMAEVNEATGMKAAQAAAPPKPPITTVAELLGTPATPIVPPTAAQMAELQALRQQSGAIESTSEVPSWLQSQIQAAPEAPPQAAEDLAAQIAEIKAQLGKLKGGKGKGKGKAPAPPAEPPPPTILTKSGQEGAPRLVGRQAPKATDKKWGPGNEGPPNPQDYKPKNPERGAATASFLTRLGLGTAGAAIGGATDPLGDPILSALAGGAIGYNIPNIARGLSSLGATSDVVQNALQDLNLPDGAKQAAAKIGRVLPQWLRAMYLADVVGLPANAWVGPYGSGLFGALERGIAGDPRGWAVLNELKNPWNFFKEYPSALKEAGDLVGRAEGFAMADATSGTEKLLTAPGTFLTGGDVAIRRILTRHGFSDDEARIITMTSEPFTKSGHKFTHLGGLIWDVTAPFKRTPTNLVEQGLLRTPGFGFIQQGIGAARGTRAADPLKLQLLQQALGGGIGYGSYKASENMTPEQARLARRFITNAAGPYSLLAAAGMAAGQARRRGQPIAGTTVRNTLQQLPMPSIEPIQDALGAGAKLIDQGPSAIRLPEDVPRGIYPASLAPSNLQRQWDALASFFASEPPLPPRPRPRRRPRP